VTRWVSSRPVVRMTAACAHRFASRSCGSPLSCSPGCLGVLGGGGQMWGHRAEKPETEQVDGVDTLARPQVRCCSMTCRCRRPKGWEQAEPHATLGMRPPTSPTVRRGTSNPPQPPNQCAGLSRSAVRPRTRQVRAGSSARIVAAGSKQSEHRAKVARGSAQEGRPAD